MDKPRTSPWVELDRTVAVETVPFSLDDVDYEIDLTVDRATSLRKLLERYIRAGRRKPGAYFSCER
ncbi:Lsr2 dimerization domain-containing protein [Amycolatopsis decaplanina]|uniref:Lsr2-like protein n=1 Tax=Amycolatopsis decaplanina DSM 44594 TaxID=1284240 RepID=M2X1S1_9PSEU|nr:histone-like nucleoid-structuring protein Lsr2 [Amycolatopsis decaplanina]EME54971.1 Lsr2-like protein [Amycolatopsis decaplanina DSM 44594]